MSRPPPAGPPNGYRAMSSQSSNPSLPNSSAHPSIASNGPAMLSQTRIAQMSRAERFEDEKRRIIESCFSKLDQNGQLAESYITHIRVMEDGVYPSTPPPPDSSSDNKKPRLIIIAVRSTGRVRMHKARENNNGSFSIGKTWNLEDLAAIESFSNVPWPPSGEQEANWRAWAGNIGFIVTITKPYYWQAGTPKEKEFFIASAVKIYRKYTKGQIPELRGFDDAQKQNMLGALPPQQQQPSQPPPDSRSQNPSQSPGPPRPPQPPFAQGSQSRDDSRYRGSPGPPPSLGSDRAPRSASTATSRHPSQSPGRNPPPAQQQPPPTPGVPKPFASTEQLRSPSREGFRQDSRPGTAPGVPNGHRSPPPPLSQMPRAPSAQSSQSQLRSESQTNLSVSSGQRPQQFRAYSPPRQPSYGSTREAAPEQNQISKSPPMSPPMNGTTGASLFQSTQQRWAEQRQAESPAQTPQLPPLQTEPQPPFANEQRKQSAGTTPKTAQSDASTPGMNATDAAAFASAAGFMGPGYSNAGPPPPVTSPPPAARSPPPPSAPEPSSPPTPERSKKRPPLEPAPLSDSQLDLRPAPLKSGLAVRNVTTPNESTYATPREAVTPSKEEPPPEIKPLSPTKNRSDSNLPAPGVLQRQALASSPLATPDAKATEEPNEEENQEQDDDYRPGLGPMIKKKAVADRMKKAAMAASAFKPRPGGAAEKILKAKAERDAKDEPDGITGVVPRPVVKPPEPKPEETVPKQVDDLAVKEPQSSTTPKVEISSPVSPARGYEGQMMGGMDGAQGVQLQDEQTPRAADPVEEKEKVEQRQIRQPQVKVKRRSAQHERYLDSLGIDRSLLTDKGLDFEMMLHDFGWNDAALSPKALADMEADLRREQSRLDAGSWLSSPSQEANNRKEREDQVLSLLDKAIQECDEMDGLLTIYNVELNSLNDDIAYIEAQSQGLQVQAANQRNLQSELSNLVSTLSLDRKILEPLRHANLSDMYGIDDAEQSLKKLYQAIISIDPTIRSNQSGRPRSRNGLNDGNELGSMAAVRQKRDVYMQQSEQFCQRLMQNLDSTFTTSFGQAKGQALVSAQGSAGAMKLNPEAYTAVRRGLWVYSPLILFTKELNPPAWQTLLRMYYSRAKPLYADSFGQNVAGWKRVARKGTGEEGDILFTAQEKDEAPSGSIASSARKLTVKRSQTLAKTLRNASGDEKTSKADSRTAGTLHYSEVFSGAMDEMAPLISQEQNFVVDLFHATSLETADFMDIVTATPPDQRYGTNLLERKPTDPDREMARRVTSTMDEIFGFFTNELSSLLDWSISLDPIQGVGVMACLSRHSYYLQDSSQEFLIQLTDTLMARLQNLFAKFVDEQIRAIEDTKVKIKKRKGVIGFMKIFPHFSAAVENTFAAVGGADYEHEAESMAEVRRRVDEAYARINRAMFDSLKVIAKESPTAPAAPKTTATDDPEDKEKMNYHVLIIENMNHYIEEVDDGGRKGGVLAEWKGRAEMERSEAMESYIGQVIRRPLGKLLEFLDSITSLLASHPSNPTAITSRPTFSRKQARNLLSQYDSKEIRRGIDQLRSRVEKHFGHGDDEAISRALVALVCKECERAYEKTISRTEDVIRELYPPAEGEKSVEMEFTVADVQAGFRK